ncbi:hypothetical protein FLA105534_00834 [Flavobacterium bizetiae]|uniref:Uncharacterized protein n=1 Tax=Flavobacterium bizetiae TaxID=2704140 RepID=A0A6J4G9K6_9FLAO|nr:hypothetical protein FLA105534_00834 [Flavobacterium bizetiae]
MKTKKALAKDSNLLAKALLIVSMQTPLKLERIHNSQFTTHNYNNYLEFLNSFKTSSITQVVLAADVPFDGLIPSLPKISATTVSIRGC